MKEQRTKELRAQLDKFEAGTELQRLEMLFDAINLIEKSTNEANKKYAPATLSKELTFATILIPFAKKLIQNSSHSSNPFWTKSLDASEPNDESRLENTDPLTAALKTSFNLQTLKSEAEEVFKSYAANAKASALWDQADELLDSALSNLNPLPQQLIRNARTNLKQKLNNPFDTVEQKAAAYKLFSLECKVIVYEIDPSVKQKVLKVYAVVLLTLLAAALGFLIGFLAGLATGPGAVLAGVVTGGAAAGAVATTAGISHAVRGSRFFKSKEEAAIDSYSVNAQTLDRLASLGSVDNSFSKIL